MKDLLVFVGLLSCLALFLKRASQKKEEKRREKLKKQLLNQQQELFRQIAHGTGLDVSQFTAPTLANVEAETADKGNFSIGWVLLFGVLFLYLFLLARPWIQALAVLGWSDFWRMLSL